MKTARLVLGIVLFSFVSADVQGQMAAVYDEQSTVGTFNLEAGAGYL